MIVADTDEYPKPNTTLEGFSLNYVQTFKKDGVRDSANASGINDVGQWLFL